jgi:hypothetical protein
MLKMKPRLFVGVWLAAFVAAAGPVSSAEPPEFDKICPKAMGNAYTSEDCTCMAGKATADERDDMAYFFASTDDDTLTDLQKAGRGGAAVTKYGAACAK